MKKTDKFIPFILAHKKIGFFFGFVCVSLYLSNFFMFTVLDNIEDKVSNFIGKSEVLHIQGIRDGLFLLVDSINIFRTDIKYPIGDISVYNMKFSDDDVNYFDDAAKNFDGAVLMVQFKK